MKNMPALHKISILFFAIGMVGIAAMQFIYNAPRPVIMPLVPVWLGPPVIWGYILGLFIIVASIAIATGKMAKQAALLLGAFLLFAALVFHTPYQLSRYPAHLGSWTDTLKALALSGGAFVIASLYPENFQSPLYRLLAKISVAGPYFFGTMMVLFGYAHFLYVDFVNALVPTWAGNATFWTYFAGVALIAGGIGIMCNIRIACILSAAMLLAWTITLHIPRGIADPTGNQGNEWTSVFEALAFSGVAFLTGTRPKRSERQLARQGIAVVHSQGRAAGY